MVYSIVILTLYLDTRISGLFWGGTDPTLNFWRFLNIAFVPEQSLCFGPVDQAIAGGGEPPIVLGRLGLVLRLTRGWSAVTYTPSFAAAVQSGRAASSLCYYSIVSPRGERVTVVYNDLMLGWSDGRWSRAVRGMYK